VLQLLHSHKLIPGPKILYTLELFPFQKSFQQSPEFLQLNILSHHYKFVSYKVDL
jgi:hypothetical protein